MSKKKNKDDLMDKDQLLENELEEAELNLDEQEADSGHSLKADSPKKETEDLQTRIAELEASVNDWKDKYLRSMAEFDNYRRRTTEEKADWIKRATEKLALHICDVLDNFDRALMQVTDEQKEDNFIKGIFMIEQQLKSALEKEGVKRIEALGQDFDPKIHEALAKIASDFEEDKVAAIIQNGYTMHDKIIRPVRVAISTGKNQDKNNKE